MANFCNFGNNLIFNKINILANSNVIFLQEEVQVRLINENERVDLKILSLASHGTDFLDLLDNLRQEFEYYLHNKLNIKSYLRQIKYSWGDEEDEKHFEEIDFLDVPIDFQGFVDIYEIPIHKRYQKADNKTTDFTKQMMDLIEKGENNQIEFKPSLLYNFKTERPGISIKKVVAKAICAFINANGGILFIGVGDDKSFQGLDFDYSVMNEQKKRDSFLLEFDSMLKHFFVPEVLPFIRETGFIENDGKDVFYSIVLPNKERPIFLQNADKYGGIKEFYVRRQASSKLISDSEEIANYVLNRYKNKQNNNGDINDT